jgi:hypothetical protein
MQSDLVVPLVTADDDILYPSTWLSGLMEYYNPQERRIVCYRAHRISILWNQIAPYKTWRPCRTVEPSLLNFITGVSGAIYPPAFLEVLKERGDTFMAVCPKNDDVWLHATAVRAGFCIMQVREKATHFAHIVNSQAFALHHQNVGNNANDAQIQKTYTAHEINKLIDAQTSAL